VRVPTASTSTPNLFVSKAPQNTTLRTVLGDIGPSGPTRRPPNLRDVAASISPIPKRCRCRQNHIAALGQRPTYFPRDEHIDILYVLVCN
jgi:hypothetical protein